jgi:hypothetical protein
MLRADRKTDVLPALAAVRVSSSKAVILRPA